MTKYYGGWLYADEDEKPKLIGLGVFGPMIWSPDDDKITKALGKTGTMSHCYCDEVTLQRLDTEYSEMWRTKYPHYQWVLEKYGESQAKYPSAHFSEIKKGEGERWDKYLPDEVA